MAQKIRAGRNDTGRKRERNGRRWAGSQILINSYLGGGEKKKKDEGKKGEGNGQKTKGEKRKGVTALQDGTENPCGL